MGSTSPSRPRPSTKPLILSLACGTQMWRILNQIFNPQLLKHHQEAPVWIRWLRAAPPQDTGRAPKPDPSLAAKCEQSAFWTPTWAGPLFQPNPSTRKGTKVGGVEKQAQEHGVPGRGQRRAPWELLARQAWAPSPGDHVLPGPSQASTKPSRYLRFSVCLQGMPTKGL